VGRSAVANWECGDRMPSAAHLQQISLVTGVSFEWLATGRGLPSPQEEWVLAVDAEIVDDPDEQMLLRAYRTCSVAQKRAVITYIGSLSPKARRSVASLYRADHARVTG
jgi:transcriptional regulator with XRE-family HTH domain